MDSINPSQTMATGHVAASDDNPSGPSSSAFRSESAPSASTFAFSVSASEASKTFSALSSLPADDLDELGDKSGDPSASKDASSKSEDPDLSGLGPAPLRRNQACLSCRKRKLRCDAARPVCATCARSRAAAAAANHPAPVPPGDCVYDDIMSSRPRASEARAPGTGPRKSSGSLNAASGSTTAGKAKTKDDSIDKTSAMMIPTAAPHTSQATFGGESTSPESSISGPAPAVRAQKRKKRDDGTAQAAGRETAGSDAGASEAAGSANGNANGIGIGGAPESLEKQMREFQLEDRIHHLERLLAQSMNRNEQMQAQFQQMRISPNAPGSAVPFPSQGTPAFTALATAGIPSAACAYPALQGSLNAGASTSTLNGSASMYGDATAAMATHFEPSRAFSISASTPAQTDDLVSMVSPSVASGSHPRMAKHDDSAASVAGSGTHLSISNAGVGLAGPAFAASSASPLSSGLSSLVVPTPAPAASSESRIANEINAPPSVSEPYVAPPDPLLELLWPGWPKDLPSPDTVHHLAEIFFAKSPLRGMIYKAQFMAGLMLPPRHPRRPHEALLHAVLAVAAPMSPHFKSKRSNPLAGGVCSPRERRQSMGAYSDPECVVPMVGDPHRRQATLDPSQLSFADFHLSQARLKIEVSMRTSTKNPIDWLQASILGAHLLWTDARFVEGFMLSGVVSRAAAPVGLFKLQSRHASDPSIPASLLAPPASATEEHERRALLWYIYLNDVYNSGAGLYWETIIDDNAVQTSLPVPMMQWQAGIDPPPNHQQLTSPDLFTSNHMDDFVLHIKSAVILKRVQQYISRNNITMFTTKRPNGYRALDNIINEFLASFTGSHHLEFGPDVTMDRLLAYNNVLLATILLHENFVSLSDRTSYSNVRTEQATKAVLQTIYELLASSYDFNLLHPYIYMAWTIAARMICRELTWQRIFGDARVVMEVSQALDTVIEALRRGGEKHLVAARSALLLDRFRQGHWSEEMLSGSIFIDGVLPGEGEMPPELRASKVTAPTRPGQPVHWYPLTSHDGSAKSGQGSSRSGPSGMDGGDPSGSANVPSGQNALSSGGGEAQQTLDIGQIAAAAASFFSNWMPQNGNAEAMRSSADPFIDGGGPAAAGGGGGGVAAAGSATAAASTAAASRSTGIGGAGGAGTGPTGMMHLSPAQAIEEQPSTPWSLMNILAPEQEGLD